MQFSEAVRKTLSSPMYYKDKCYGKDIIGVVKNGSITYSNLTGKLGIVNMSIHNADTTFYLVVDTNLSSFKGLKR
jgi:hypothetical protein